MIDSGAEGYPPWQTDRVAASARTTKRLGASRRTRIVLLVAGTLFIVCLVNWIAVSVHIADLRRQAVVELTTHGNADDAAQRGADAAGFRDARSAFELLTLTSAAVLIGGTAYQLRRYRSRPS